MLRPISANNWFSLMNILHWYVKWLFFSEQQQQVEQQQGEEAPPPVQAIHTPRNTPGRRKRRGRPPVRPPNGDPDFLPNRLPSRPKASGKLAMDLATQNLNRRKQRIQEVRSSSWLLPQLMYFIYLFSERILYICIIIFIFKRCKGKKSFSWK